MELGQKLEVYVCECVRVHAHIYLYTQSVLRYLYFKLNVTNHTNSVFWRVFFLLSSRKTYPGDSLLNKLGKILHCLETGEGW